MSNLHEDYESAQALEQRTRQLMTSSGMGRMQAHVQASRELGLAEGDDDGRGSGRLNLGRVVAGLLLVPALIAGLAGAGWADPRGEMPDNRCPGSGCPDNAKPQG